MLKQEEIQRVIDSIELPKEFEWYCDEIGTKVFAVRGIDGGVVATWISYLFFKPNYQESPFDGFDLGRKGLHKIGENTWFALEFYYSKNLTQVRYLIEHAMLELARE